MPNSLPAQTETAINWQVRRSWCEEKQLLTSETPFSLPWLLPFFFFLFGRIFFFFWKGANFLKYEIRFPWYRISSVLMTPIWKEGGGQQYEARSRFIAKLRGRRWVLAAVSPVQTNNTRISFKITFYPAIVCLYHHPPYVDARWHMELIFNFRERLIRFKIEFFVFFFKCSSYSSLIFSRHFKKIYIFALFCFLASNLTQNYKKKFQNRGSARVPYSVSTPCKMPWWRKRRQNVTVDWILFQEVSSFSFFFLTLVTF